MHVCTRISLRTRVYRVYQGESAILKADISLVKLQGGSNMTGTDLCVNKPQSVPVIFEPPCTSYNLSHLCWNLKGYSDNNEISFKERQLL